MNFNERLADLRRRRGLSQEQLGYELGVFYVSREDPSVVVPRRFGVGWAMNWGNPRSWGLVALLAAAVAAFVAVVEVLIR